MTPHTGKDFTTELRAVLAQSARFLYAASLTVLNEQLNAHASEVVAVEFSADGENVISGSTDSTVKVFDPSGESILALTMLYESALVPSNAQGHLKPAVQSL